MASTNGRGQMWTGIILILLGAIALLDRLLIFRLMGRFFELMEVWWPSFWIALGLAWLVLVRPRKKLAPLLMVLIGAILQVGELGIFWWWTWDRMWPLVLVGIGLWMLAARVRPGSFGTEGGTREFSGEALDAFVLCGALERAVTSPAFRGGEATAVCGGMALDLTRAKLAPGEQRMKLFALCGGIELRVPQEMNVVIQGTPLLGSIEDTRPAAAPSAKELTAAELAAAPVTPPRLLVDASAILGAIEIR